MLDTLVVTLSAISTLFIYMAIGFVLTRLGILPRETSKVLSKLVVWVFYPALGFITMAKNCTVETLEKNATNIIFSTIALGVAIVIALLIAPFFARKDSYEIGIYKYSLTFANNGYMGDPLVQAIYGDLALSYYKFLTLPLNIAIYTWGVSNLIPKDKSGKNNLIRIINPSTVAIILGIVFGISGLGKMLPEFATNVLDSLKACMGPSAMLLAGCTVAGYKIPNMLKNKKAYIATGLRLILLPTLILSLIYFIKEGANLAFGLRIDNSFLLLLFFAFATPLGLNTVVYPESFGGDPEPGAGMTLISHTLCVITIPILFSIMTLILGQYT